jgi:hypothetical protein
MMLLLDKRFRALTLDAIGLKAIKVLFDDGALQVDSGRERPRYFDGRFLAARDLTRDQKYFLLRQRELMRAAGPGVLHGLDVAPIGDARVRVGRGAGITPAGELVVLRDDVTVDLFEAPDVQRLDAALGALSRPSDPLRRRTGLFVLGARPVEYTANPVTSYPADLQQRRRAQDGDVIEATAITIVPYVDEMIDAEPSRQRASLAHRIFVERRPLRAPAEIVPLAIVQLDRGVIRWADQDLVRRELGPEIAGIDRFGATVQAMREAHVQQYEHHLAAILAARSAAGRPTSFLASEEFAALPAVGTYPMSALDLVGLTQAFLPPMMRVDLMVVPDDEIAVLVDESLALPPIDLGAPAEELARLRFAVVLPLPRERIASVPPAQLTAPLRAPFEARPVRRLRRPVLERLDLLSLRRLHRVEHEHLASLISQDQVALFVRCRHEHVAPEAAISRPAP